MKALSLLKEVRDHLAPLNKRILSHRYILEAETGQLALAQVRAFALNQYYIVSYDIRSLSLMLARSVTAEEAVFFKGVLDGDLAGLGELVKLADSLGLSRQELEAGNVTPEAAAYTHYLAALAGFAQPGEQAMALIVNLPVWGANCVRLAAALRNRYHVTETGFLDIFASPLEEAERSAAAVMENYLPQRKEPMQQAARLVQAYELMFWDGIYSPGTS